MCLTGTRTPNTRRSAGSRRGRGAVVLELLICLPIWLLGLLAIVEFAELVTRLQQVALASRVGAHVASQIPVVDMPGTDGAPVPDVVLDAIDNQMGSASMAACKVYLQHNVGGGSVVTLVSGTCDVDPPLGPPPLPHPLPPGEFVRVTVYAKATELAPNLLQADWLGGLDISTWHVRETTTFAHE